MDEEETTEEVQKETGLFKQVLRGRIAGERELVESSGLSPQMAVLRQWQVGRLAQTHDDLLRSKRYGRACQFFLSDIYGAKDFSQRDTDAENVYRTMRKYLPERLLTTMGKTIQLNQITQQLDSHLLDVLVNQLGMTDTLTAEMYAAAYRLCDNYETRQKQLVMVLDVGRGVDNLTRIPMIGMVLRAARHPATRSGWSELQDFMERGFAAFKEMRGADQFLAIVEQRERQILDQIFANAPHPFSIAN
ncbi:MAG TPA: hypothetical protein PLD25_05700 [Chloroflexota bacterium]|nr:hypothetical protein [Chloroflexota bacterium]